MIFVFWQAQRLIRDEIVAVMNKVCYDVGLRKQHFGYQNSWDCWYFVLLLWVWVLLCVDVGSAY
jgi:hypothetical protein